MRQDANGSQEGGWVGFLIDTKSTHGWVYIWDGNDYSNI